VEAVIHWCRELNDQSTLISLYIIKSVLVLPLLLPVLRIEFWG
jgi:hypothetical protein